MRNNLGALSLIIPCFNEECAISAVLNRCQSFRSEALKDGRFSTIEIIVVDDGSTDLSPDLIAAFSSVRLLRLPKRLGYGAAIKTGLLEAHSDWIAMMDMDATYDPMDFLAAFSHIEKNRNLVVLGDRLSRIGEMPLTRQIGNRLFVGLIRIFHKRKVFDSCTGFRLFRRDWAKALIAELPDDLNFSIALTMEMLNRGSTFVEIPISYGNRRGKSKLNILSDGFEFLWTIISRPSLNKKAAARSLPAESRPR